MNVSLYILGQLADIEPQDLKGEYNLANVGDLSKRLGSKTNQFTLPPTANNQAIFENANQTLSNTGLPYIMIPCQLISDGIDMKFSKLILNSSGDYGFKVTLFDTSASFFDLIKNKELKDLNLKHLNHHWRTFELATYDDINSPLLYPVTDCQVDSPNAGFPNNDNLIFLGVLLPMINENYLVDKIISESGYTLENVILNENYFNDRVPVVPVGANNNLRSDDFSRYNALFKMSQFGGISSIGGSIIGGSFVYIDSVISQNERYYRIDGTLTNYPKGPTTSVSYFKIPEYCKVRIRVKFEYRRVSGNNPVQFRFNVLPTPLDITAGNGIFSPYHLDLDANNTWQSVDEIFEFECKERTTAGLMQTELTGFYLWIQTRLGSLPATDAVQNRNATIEIISCEQLAVIGGTYETTYTSTAEQSLGLSYRTIANQLADMTQAEFIKQYCLKYGCVILVDEFRNKVKIKPYKDFTNVAYSDDWSGRVDYTEKPQILYQVDNIIGEYSYGEKMEKYGENGMQYPKPVGTDLKIELPEVFKQKKIELKYDASITQVRSNGIEVAWIGCFKDYEYVRTEKMPCLMMRQDTGDFRYSVTQFPSAEYTTIDNRHFTTYFIESANVFNLGFDNDLFNIFYASISKAINDKPIIIKCFMRLGIDKIANFSGENPVYIKELDGYYIVNKIVTSLNTNDSAEVELIKIKL
jgi:hypothetical protein